MGTGGISKAMTTKDRVLKPELDLFEKHRREWLPLHLDKFAVVLGTTVAGFYPDFESAYRAGVRRFGFTDFLIKQVCAEDPVYVIY
jgi:hypothetical protein